YAAMAKSVMESALDAGDTLEHAGQRLLSGAIEVYAPAKGDHLGCLIATTATTAAGSNPAVRAALSAFLSDVDQLIRAAIKRRFGGELAEGSVAAAADVLSAAMYSIAIRARAGASRRQLSAIAERAVATMGMIARTRA
ncbi:MAG: hypothetical protein JNL07_00360, partial [Rhodospirillales bacterium]|nr:hypothetical protein [Rhodospirillales bacterium]